MTDEQRQEIERLDRWLAVAEVTGRGFEAGDHDEATELFAPLPKCAMICYYHEEDPANRLQVAIGTDMVVALEYVNDENNGSPGAVRAELHRLFPFLTETPAPTEVPTHA